MCIIQHVSEILGVPGRVHVRSHVSYSKTWSHTSWLKIYKTYAKKLWPLFSEKAEEKRKAVAKIFVLQTQQVPSKPECKLPKPSN